MTATLLEKLEAWLSNYGGAPYPDELPAATTVMSLEGHAYVRWTPTWEDHPPVITIAKIEYSEHLRGKGRFTKLLTKILTHEDCLVTVESVLNVRLNTFLRTFPTPTRTLIVTGMVPDCPTFTWMPR